MGAKLLAVVSNKLVITNTVALVFAILNAAGVPLLISADTINSILLFAISAINGGSAANKAFIGIKSL